MKKHVSLLLLALALSFSGKAQYVTLPDANFVTWLNANGYSACLNGNDLDTTCSAVLTATTISCNSANLTDLTGIQYFKALYTLDCSSNSITNIPLLPSYLVNFKCQNNQLSNLPYLPDTMSMLYCGYNNLQSLPVLPYGLNYLSCESNQLASLPALPPDLSVVNCNGNLITALPVFTHGMYLFWCNSNLLTSLPTLPDTLLGFDCSYNQLDSLPSLPPYMGTLNCSGNNFHTLPPLPLGLGALICENLQLTVLPALPHWLSNLDCANNLLTSLPALPPFLTALNCRQNQLSSLPSFSDTLRQLLCDNNLLTSLPVLPDSMFMLSVNGNPGLSCLPQLKRIYSLNFGNTAITCLPDYGSVTSSTPPLDSVPLCGIYSATGCGSFFNISGRCYYDANSDCIFDSTDVGTNYVKTQLLSGGNVVQQVYTGGEGFYSFDEVAYGNYTVRTDPSGLPFIVACPATGSFSIHLSAADSLSYDSNFAFKCRTDGIDLGVQGIINTGAAPRPGSNIYILTTAGDMSQIYGARCAANNAGAVQLTYTGPVKYLSPGAGALTPTAVNGNTLNWVVPDFGAVNDFESFGLIFQVDSTATPGTPVCIAVTVSPTTGDYDLSNNALNYCFNVVDALDPNEKEVYPAQIDSVDQWLTYTIRFQNTGNAPALNIRVTDTLSSYLDPASFTLLAYSAKNLTQVFGNAVVFNFPNINLPDSAADPVGSIGFVQFKVKTNSSISTGNQVNNTASIYFDLNSAVVTNTVTDTVTGAGLLGINTPPATGDIQITACPNPFNDLTNIQITGLTGAGNYNFELYDVTGRLQLSIASGTTNHFQINRGKLAAGVYTYRLVIGEEGTRAFGKLVIQ